VELAIGVRVAALDLDGDGDARPTLMGTYPDGAVQLYTAGVAGHSMRMRRSGQPLEPMHQQPTKRSKTTFGY
jgi:hypothetical protein